MLQTKTYTALLSDGNKYNLTVELGNHTTFPVSYVKGRAPHKSTELALSGLNAEELGLTVGDRLQLMTGGSIVNYTVCGIYSDITNTTAYCVEDDIPTMWSIIYVSLKPSVSKEQWLDEHNDAGAKAVDIVDYVSHTDGQTIREIKLASLVAAGTAVIIIFVVVTLFMRLIVERNRYSVSLHKALGFTNTGIEKSYMLKGLLPAAAGTAAGLILGGILGEYLCGIVLKSFGASGFRFVPEWSKVLLILPAISLLAASAAIRLGTLEIRRVKAFECCMRKE